MKAPAALALAALVLAGCSEPPDAGYVVDKKYEAAYDWMYLQCGAYDSKGWCVVHVPVVVHEPERWKLCLRSDVDRKHTGCRDVDPLAYARYEVGQHYPDAR